MFFNSLNRKLKKSYLVLNRDIQAKVFPKGEPEYIYVGTMLDVLFKKQDVLKLIQIYASVYTYYLFEMGNIAKTLDYASKKAAGILSSYDCRKLIALVMLNITPNKAGISNPVEAVDTYRGFVYQYMNTVESIKKHYSHFETMPISAGTINGPILVNGIRGIHEYIGALKVPGVEKISFSRTSTLHLTDTLYNVSYAIDEYTLTNAANGTKIASLWFNIYGTENTNVQPVCFSDKTPFSASKVADELFDNATKEWQAIEEICQTAQISYDHKKLVISSFVYFYIVWTFSFKHLRAGQSLDLKEMYVDGFIQYNREAFAGFPEDQISDNEQAFQDMLRRVDGRIRDSYHANNHTLVDDGLSDEFIFEFISDRDSVSKIKAQIVKKIMTDWVALGQKADQTYLT